MCHVDNGITFVLIKKKYPFLIVKLFKANMDFYQKCK